MVKIRLKRFGAKHRPVYRIVVIDQRKRRDGRPIEEIGTYDPKTEPVSVSIDKEALNKWVNQGAQLSATVQRLVKNATAEATA